jgi:4-hydroxybenzoyl-CoA thioesterase
MKHAVPRQPPHPGTGAPARVFSRVRRIRFSDCDPAGIVFYPQYFVMLNDLVEDWVDNALGLGYRKIIIDRKVGLPTVRVDADFRAPSHMGDTVTLSLVVERLGGRSLTLNLHCEGEGGDTRMAMRQVIVTTSLVTLHAIDMPADLRAAIEGEWRTDG